MKPRTDRLIKLFNALPRREQDTLLEFTEFLHQRHAVVEQEIAEPKFEQPAENETVVAAIKRLSRSYFMLDKSSVLHEASGLMSQHLLQGREASVVIQELEQLFDTHYKKMVGNH